MRRWVACRQGRTRACPPILMAGLPAVAGLRPRASLRRLWAAPNRAPSAKFAGPSASPSLVMLSKFRLSKLYKNRLLTPYFSTCAFSLPIRRNRGRPHFSRFFLRARFLCTRFAPAFCPLCKPPFAFCSSFAPLACPDEACPPILMAGLRAAARKGPRSVEFSTRGSLRNSPASGHAFTSPQQEA